MPVADAAATASSSRFQSMVIPQRMGCGKSLYGELPSLNLANALVYTVVPSSYQAVILT